MAKLKTKDNEIEIPNRENIRKASEEIGVPFNCRNGTCGTCMIDIVSGEEKTVFVREVGDEKKHCFRVWGEVVPQYYAKYIEV